MSFKSIAIDGPSGAGKSTLAKRLAEELGFLYVDTGAIYRTVGLSALRRGVEPADEAQVKAILPSLRIGLSYGADGFQRMTLDGEDVTAAIREHRISACASQVSAHPSVRDFLMEQQRSLARTHNVIMDGRDIGTVVLPHADLKIFLTASPEARAKRRYEELLARGQNAVYEEILRDVNERDRQDTHRSAAPLRQAEDAILVDTTQNSFEESFARLRALVKERLHE